MNTERENNHGEYWPSPFAITFPVKKVWAWLLTFFLISGTCFAQVSYCGVDVNKDLTPNGGVAKQTLSNLALRSEEFDNASWTKGDVTITANSVIAPDGTLTADSIKESATTASHVAYVTVGTVTSGLTYRMSVYAKPISTGRYLQVATAASGFTTNRFANFDLANGTVEYESGVVSSKIAAVGNGWYKCTIEVLSTATLTSSINIGGSTTATSVVFPSYLGDITKGFYVWGASAQLSTAPPDYLATTTVGLTLGPLCPVGYTQSLTDPSRCFIVGPVTSRNFRTW